MHTDPSRGSAEWLSLSAAAERLNVHPTTLRRWADEGRIPFMLTPGGHRRFAAEDVDQLGSRRRAVRRVGPVEKIWADQALKKTRERLMSRPDEAWREEGTTESRDTHRKLGQQLMRLTLRFLTEDDDGDALLKEAREIGHEYARSARHANMPLTQVLGASMFFRDALLTTAIQLPDNMRIPAGSQTRLVGRINEILNQVQLGVAEEFDRASK